MKIYNFLLASLLSDSNRWTQGWLAKTKEGKSCITHSKDAYAFCFLGAISKSSNINDVDKRMAVRAEIHNVVEKAIKIYIGKAQSIEQFNDCRSHHDVLKVIDIAIGLV